MTRRVKKDPQLFLEVSLLISSNAALCIVTRKKLTWTEKISVITILHRITLFCVDLSKELSSYDFRTDYITITQYHTLGFGVWEKLEACDFINRPSLRNVWVNE